VLADPEIVADCLSKKARHYSKMGKYLLEPLVGDGLIFNEGMACISACSILICAECHVVLGEPWKRQRGLLNPSFHAQHMKEV